MTFIFVLLMSLSVIILRSIHVSANGIILVCFYGWVVFHCEGFPGGTVVKGSSRQCRKHNRCGFSNCIQKIPEVGNSTVIQYSCLKNSMYQGAWQTIVHGVTKSQTWLSDRAPSTNFSLHIGIISSLSIHQFMDI